MYSIFKSIYVILLHLDFYMYLYSTLTTTTFQTVKTQLCTICHLQSIIIIIVVRSILFLFYLITSYKVRTNEFNRMQYIEAADPGSKINLICLPLIWNTFIDIFHI